MPNSASWERRTARAAPGSLTLGADSLVTVTAGGRMPSAPPQARGRIFRTSLSASASRSAAKARRPMPSRAVSGSTFARTPACSGPTPTTTRSRSGAGA
ncbi:hypothetical protein, partial [Streptomyces sp. WAC06614]|uniref:hypothetical protein n=1 Tax=Streptomyces sp. WAC06614 TaxID=2487416 RepID=UPI001C8E606C